MQVRESPGAVPTCPKRNEIQSLHMSKGATGGSFDWAIMALSITVDWDFTAAEVQAALEALATISSGDVLCTGGPLPYTSITVEFKGNLKYQRIPVGQVDISNLQGDNPLVIPIRDQMGFPGNAYS